MRKQKRLASGTHILALPLIERTPLAKLFPWEVSGSRIEKLGPDGNWLRSEKILFENNRLTVSELYQELEPFETIRLTLKRDIEIDWDVSFKSYSGLKQSTIKFAEGFDYKEALYLAQLSNLVYEDETQIKQILDDRYQFDNIRYYSEQSYKKIFKKGLLSLLYVYLRNWGSVVDLQFMHLNRRDAKTGKNLIVVVFRGSQEPQDWMTNITFRDINFLRRGGVHQGLNHALKLYFKTQKQSTLDISAKLPASVNDDIESLNRNTRIILTGHSLGGSLATLVTCFLCEIGIQSENLETYTFGAPPVGTEEFCDYYQDKLNIYRLVNQNDVIPKLDRITKFLHIGTEIVLPSNQGEVHSCEGYIDNIIDCMKDSEPS